MKKQKEAVSKTHKGVENLILKEIFLRSSRKNFFLLVDGQK